MKLGSLRIRLPKQKKTVSPDGSMELVEHLAELRTRIFRSLFYIAVGMVLTYNLFGAIYEVLLAPLGPILQAMNGQLPVRNIADAFLLRMQVCFLAGLTVAFPLVTLELWGFVAPALTPEERRPVTFLAPFSVLLFLSGAGTAYACLPATYSWMAGFITDIPFGTLFQDPQQYMLLTVKILLAFGLAFQLPIVLLFLARIGLITAEMMTKYWRHATVIIAIAAALLTPSNDPLTMLMMGVPMAGLYLLSIGLVRAFEPGEDGQPKKTIGSMVLISLVPVALLIAVSFWLWRTHAFHIAPYQKTLAAAELQKIQEDAEAQKARQEQTETTQKDQGERLRILEEQVEQQTRLLEELREELRQLREARQSPTAPAPRPTPTEGPLLEGVGGAAASRGSLNP